VIYLSPEDLAIVRAILFPYKSHEFNVFGSRSRGDHKKFSDVDICYLRPLPREAVGDIKEQLSNSNLPYMVDLVDWTRCSPEFRDLVKDDLVPLF